LHPANHSSAAIPANSQTSRLRLERTTVRMGGSWGRNVGPGNDGHKRSRSTRRWSVTFATVAPIPP
jgi:hypothetical protein